MKDEIKRIMNLVQEGKLSPEDAAELIDAFQTPDQTTQSEGPDEQQASAEAKSESEPKSSSASQKDPLKGIIDYIENIGKDVSESVNWQEVAGKVREGAQKGFEHLKGGIDKLMEGKVNFDFFATQELRVIEMDLQFAPGRGLKVENPCGEVKIYGTDDQPKVKASVRVKGSDLEDARRRAAEFTLLVEESDHQVLIRQPETNGISLDLELWVPRGTTVEARTHSGNLTIVETSGAAKVNASSGNILLRGLDGAIEIVSQSGNINLSDIKSPSMSVENRSGSVRLERALGNINIRTASGNLTMAACGGKTISVESVSGNVSMDLVEAVSGSVSVRTVNGNSTVAVADGSDARVSLSTLRGMVTCAIELSDLAKTDQHVTGRLGNGNGTIDVSAVNGMIAFKLRDHAETSSSGE